MKNRYMRMEIARGIEFGKEGVYRDEVHDFGKGVIKGVSVMRKGFVKDERGWEIDDITLDQVIGLGNGLSMGMKTRFGHPNMSGSALGTFVGRTKNFRKVNDIVRGDLYIDKTAYNTPNGDLGTYIINLAESDPSAFGMSLAPGSKELEERVDENGLPKKDQFGNKLPPLLRIKAVNKVDVVDDPAATDGFFDKYTDSVKLSASMSAFLDSFLEDENAVDKTIEFLERYSNNKQTKDKEESIMDLSALTLDELQKSRADLIESVVKSVVKKAKEEAFEAGKNQERERVTQILKKSADFSKSGSSFDDIVLKSIESNLSTDQAEIMMKDRRISDLEKGSVKSPGFDKEPDTTTVPVTFEERCKHEWDNNPKLQSEFSSFEAYKGFKQYEESRN